VHEIPERLGERSHALLPGQRQTRRGAGHRPSAFLPNGEGMFRFSTPQQAAAAFEAINADYERQCRAARDLVEAYFDAKQVAESILSHALNDVRAHANA